MTRLTPYIWDLETDGLLDEVTRIHVMVIRNLDTGERWVFRHNDAENTIPEGIVLLLKLAEDGLLVAHNGTAYDCKVLEKLHGVVIPWHKQRDTMVLSRLIWADLKKIDLERRKKKAGRDFPGQLIGSHSLEAWGHRLGLHKGDYRGDPEYVRDLVSMGHLTLEQAQKRAYAERWDAWNQAMEDYCVLDVDVTAELYRRIEKRSYSLTAVLLETQVAAIVARQVNYGFLFDQEKAGKLYSKLVARKLVLEAEVNKVFRPLYLPDGPTRGAFTPKRDSKQHGYVADAPMTKVKLVDFNPSSRDHCAYWLKLYYGWEPTEFTADGKAKVDDEVIAKLPYDEAKPLKEYFMVAKRIGQLAEGKEAWLRHIQADGRIHGSLNTNGAVTGRMTHSRPNMGQVPAGYSPYGHECRELFCVPRGKKLVGADADALELRDLAGYMARYDDGAYIRTVLEGDKKQGTDMHSVNARALGLDPKQAYFGTETGRDIAKTWFYAFIYGAGDEKLGVILTRKKGQATRGKASKAAFLKALPALGKLVVKVQAVVKERGYLIGQDGRELSVRSSHAALNTLLQSAGAVQMKRALCLLDDSLQEAGLIPGSDYEFVANTHDEWQVEVNDGLEEMVGKLAVASIRRAGESFGFRCPLDGEWKSGSNWNETH